MKRILFGIIIQLIILLNPLVGFAVKPVSVVFKSYHESIRILNSNTALASITFITANPLTETLLLPFVIDQEQITNIKFNSSEVNAFFIKIEGRTYLSIGTVLTDNSINNVISVEFKMQNFLEEDGFLFKNKTFGVPLISNYPSSSKNNIFIDEYKAQIEIPAVFELSKNYLKKGNVDYKIETGNTSPSKESRVFTLSASYLNLRSIKHITIQFTGGLNPYVLLGIILGLLALYLVYFSNLMKFKEPQQDNTEGFQILRS